MSKNINKKKMWLIGLAIIAMMSIISLKPCNVKADTQANAENIVKNIEFSSNLFSEGYVDFPLLKLQLKDLKSDLVKIKEENGKFVKELDTILGEISVLDSYDFDWNIHDAAHVKRQFSKIVSDIHKVFQDLGISIDFGLLDRIADKIGNLSFKEKLAFYKK